MTDDERAQEIKRKISAAVHKAAVERQCPRCRRRMALQPIRGGKLCRYCGAMVVK